MEQTASPRDVGSGNFGRSRYCKDAVPDATALIRIQLDLFRGTLARLLRASERPMAIACFRLFTVPPLPPFPDFKVPRFLRRIALLTDLPAAFPYLAILVSFLSKKLQGRIDLCVRPHAIRCESCFECPTRNDVAARREFSGSFRSRAPHCG
jgi:hypothetical protein